MHAALSAPLAVGAGHFPRDRGNKRHKDQRDRCDTRHHPRMLRQSTGNAPHIRRFRPSTAAPPHSSLGPHG